MKKTPLSIYFHWPYCLSKCPYCDFFKKVEKHVDQEQIIDSYCKELEYYHNILNDREIISIFFGGGTPSLIKPQLIEKLINKISILWPTDPNIEISLEANPNSERHNMFTDLKSAGINRLSLGVQALNDQDLRFLGRTHSLKQALNCINQVLSTFDNHSIDLMYALPNQMLSSWENDLKTVVSLGLKHISLYQLTIEENTVFQKKNIKPLDDENATIMYQFTVDYLRAHGYPRYEVSNYASAPYESRHNKCYWQGDDYIGIGQSAHGRLKIGQKHFALTHPHISEELTSFERAEELTIMGLRLQKGIDKAHFKQISGLDFDQFINQITAQNLIENGYILETKQTFSATDKGFLVLNKLIEELLT